MAGTANSLHLLVISLTGGRILRDIEVFILNAVILKELLDPPTPGACGGGIDLHLFGTHLLL